jgi:choloylglycine hydrolase
MMVNKAGMAKIAAREGNPARWTSRYGSVTFNQYGREFPNGGMNEAGLVVEIMWLDGARYPAADARPSVGVLQWIQYQLDNHATVAEVLASDAAVRIATNAAAPLHFLVADAAGEAATVEFLGGEMVAHTGDELPFPVLTNTIYDASVRYTRARLESGSIPEGDGSMDRFARAAGRIDGYTAPSSDDAVAYAFETLASVAQGTGTVWSIVYDIDGRTIHATTRDNPVKMYVRFEELDFDCETPVRIVDVNQAAPGDLATQMKIYREADNLELIRASFSETGFLRNVPESTIRRAAAYPRSATCDAGENAGRKSSP